MDRWRRETLATAITLVATHGRRMLHVPLAFARLKVHLVQLQFRAEVLQDLLAARGHVRDQATLLLSAHGPHVLIRLAAIRISARVLA